MKQKHYIVQCQEITVQKNVKRKTKNTVNENADRGMKYSEIADVLNEYNFNYRFKVLKDINVIHKECF